MIKAYEHDTGTNCKRKSLKTNKLTFSFLMTSTLLFQTSLECPSRKGNWGETFEHLTGLLFGDIYMFWAVLDTGL